MPNGKSSAKQMQAVTEEPPSPREEPRIRVTLRTNVGFEYHEVYAASAVLDLLDPDVPDGFIRVSVPKDVRSVQRRYLHTSNIAEVDVHDPLPESQTDKLAAVQKQQAKNGG